ncbi:MAG: cation transporter [Bacteroidales bacterium]|nr:cation transporter [Bacteroidales bacterium]MBN2821536.1 cation transporter [Bacteroidales bacterium]
MKKYSLIIITILISTFLGDVLAQDAKTVTAKFHVDGVCMMCKERIENAAYIKGVKTCEWDKETGELEVVYNTEKTTLDKIHKSIAKAGHSTSKEKADSDAYAKLPKCCAYDNGAEKH